MNPSFSTCDDHDSLEDTGSFQKSVTLDLRNVSHPSPYYKVKNFKSIIIKLSNSVKIEVI